MKKSLTSPTQIYNILKKYYGVLAPPLDANTNEQLTIAVILSAQCTDERVNLVTPNLFKKYPDMFSLAQAKLKDIEKLIFSTGFYRNKSKNLLALANILVEKHNGKIPNDFEILINLPGIGRKTANVVMNQAFDQSVGIVVDTHVKRITKLLKFTQSDNVTIIERDLMKVWPKRLWKDYPLLLIFLGREFCKARKRNCPACILMRKCPSADLA